MSSGFREMRMSVRGSLGPSGQRRWCLLHRRRKSRGTDPLCQGEPTWRLLFAPGDGDGDGDSHGHWSLVMVMVFFTAMKMPANWTDIKVPETTLFNSGANHSAGRKMQINKKNCSRLPMRTQGKPTMAMPTTNMKMKIRITW